MLCVLVFACRDGGCSRFLCVAADDISDRAHKLHFSSIVLDTHDDTTQRFFTNTFDIGEAQSRRARGHSAHARRRDERDFLFDLDRWAHHGAAGGAEGARSDRCGPRKRPQEFEGHGSGAHGAKMFASAHKQGKIAALMGVEGGHMIGNDIRMVRIFADLGVRYMTLVAFL